MRLSGGSVPKREVQGSTRAAGDGGPARIPARVSTPSPSPSTRPPGDVLHHEAQRSSRSLGQAPRCGSPVWIVGRAPSRAGVPLRQSPLER